MWGVPARSRGLHQAVIGCAAHSWASKGVHWCGGIQLAQRVKQEVGPACMTWQARSQRAHLSRAITPAPDAQMAVDFGP